MTDENLMLEVRDGKIDQSAVLFERYHIGLYNYFLIRSKDQVLSEDLTQNVFERMIKYRHSFRADSRFKGWIFTIARNVRMDYYRNQKIKTNELTEHEEDLVLEPSIEDVLTHVDDSNKLKQALDILEASYREVLYLTRFQEMKYKDVAVLLNCTEGTVKSKVHRALNKLKTIYFQLN